MNDKVRVALVHLVTDMNRTRIRWEERKLRDGSITPQSDKTDSTNDTWQLLPYPIALLQAYAQQHASNPERYEFLLPLCQRMPVEEAVARLRGAHIVGFSAYVWNIRLSLAIARRLKEECPDTLIIFGGHQVPNEAEDFLRENRFIDIVCHGEGEQVFLDILEHSQDRDWSSIQAVSYLERDGSFVHHPRQSNITDLASIPSPYLSGTLKPLMDANPQAKWMALWETNRGCPFACSFCDWGTGVNARVHRFDMERVAQELEWFADHEIEYVVCCDANFGLLRRDVEIAELAAKTRRDRGYPLALSVQNTKNVVSRAYQVQKTLGAAQMNAGVSLSLQTMNPVVLENINRKNISMDAFRQLQHLYRRDGIETYTDFILALPGETYDSFADGISEVIASGQHSRLFFYNCSILPNAEMGSREYQQRFGIRFVPQRTLAAHSSIAETEADEVTEYIDTVVSTDAMPPDAWIRAKTLWWVTDLVYYNRLLQVPFVLLHFLYGVDYRPLLEAIADAPAQFPVLAEIGDLLRQQAREVQRGGDELMASQEWLGLWWPADQYALLKLATEWKLEAFYSEAEQALADCLREQDIAFDPQVLHEAVTLNRGLFRMPFQISNLQVELSHNIWEYYQACVTGSIPVLRQGSYPYRIFRMRPVWLNWEDWYEHVIFCHHQKSYYLYDIRPVRQRQAAVGAPAHSRAATPSPVSQE